MATMAEQWKSKKLYVAFDSYSQLLTPANNSHTPGTDYAHFMVVEEMCITFYHFSRYLLNRYAPQLPTALESDQITKLENVSSSTIHRFHTWLQQLPYWDTKWVSGANHVLDEDFKFTGNDKAHGILHFMPKNRDGDCDDDLEDDDWAMAMPTIKMYLFATKYDIPLLQQDATDRLVLCCMRKDKKYLRHRKRSSTSMPILFMARHCEIFSLMRSATPGSTSEKIVCLCWRI